jgi:hypothetical protein
MKRFMNVRNRMIDNMLATGKPFTISLVLWECLRVEHLKGSLPSKSFDSAGKAFQGQTL